MHKGIIIQFPGVAMPVRPPEPSPAEIETSLAGAIADALRAYRNAYGIEDTRAAVFAQMYVLGIVETPDLVLKSLGIIFDPKEGS